MSVGAVPWTADEAFLQTLSVRFREYAAYRGVKHRAEDVAQNTLMVLTTKYAGLDDRDEVVKVGYGICRRKVLEALRERTHKGLDDPAAAGVADSSSTPEDAAAGGEQARRLKVALAQLGHRCRQLVKLRLIGYDTRRISELMAAPPATVHVWEHRCRKQLIAAVKGGLR